MNVISPVESEILTPDELTEISGRARKDNQRRWLVDNGWKYITNAAGAPIVGRWYARMKMAGVDLSAAVVGPAARVAPDFSKVR